MSSNKYNLEFHEALKAAQEKGVIIENDLGNKYKYTSRGLEYYDNSHRTFYAAEEIANITMRRKWRVYVDPIKKEFHTLIEQKTISMQDVGSERMLANVPFDEMNVFNGKKVKVTIEEILE